MFGRLLYVNASVALGSTGSAGIRLASSIRCAAYFSNLNRCAGCFRSMDLLYVNGAITFRFGGGAGISSVIGFGDSDLFLINDRAVSIGLLDTDGLWCFRSAGVGFAIADGCSNQNCWFI